MKKLALGIGDWSKRFLEPKELHYGDWQFGVLDCWSKVQVVDIIEEELEHAGGGTIKHIRDLSYFITQPQVAVRLGEDKYVWSETGKVLKLAPRYREKLRSLLDADLPAVIKSCSIFDQVLVVMATDELIAVEWMSALLTKIHHNKTRVLVLSAFPADWEGGFGKVCAEQVCDQMRNFPAEHFVFYQQELARYYGKRTLKEYTDASEAIFCEALQQMLKEGSPTDIRIRKL